MAGWRAGWWAGGPAGGPARSPDACFTPSLLCSFLPVLLLSSPVVLLSFVLLCWAAWVTDPGGRNNPHGSPFGDEATVESQASRGPNTCSLDWSNEITTFECHAQFAEPPFPWSLYLYPVPTFRTLIPKDLVRM